MPDTRSVETQLAVINSSLLHIEGALTVHMANDIERFDEILAKNEVHNLRNEAAHEKLLVAMNAILLKLARDDGEQDGRDAATKRGASILSFLISSVIAIATIIFLKST
jgi:hypothetical protein